jgi:hypothetical protein
LYDVSPGRTSDVILQFSKDTDNNVIEGITSLSISRITFVDKRKVFARMIYSNSNFTITDANQNSKMDPTIHVELSNCFIMSVWKTKQCWPFLCSIGGTVLIEGEFNDQGDTKWIVIRGPLWGHNDKPFRRPTPGRPISRPGVGRSQGVIGVFSYYQ